MSYKRGDVKLIQPCPTREKSKDKYCECEDEDHHAIYGYVNDRYVPLQSGAYLHHSCDEWVIGGLEEVEAMIGDLRQIRYSLGASRHEDNDE